MAELKKTPIEHLSYVHAMIKAVGMPILINKSVTEYGEQYKEARRRMPRLFSKTRGVSYDEWRDMAMREGYTDELNDYGDILEMIATLPTKEEILEKNKSEFMVQEEDLERQVENNIKDAENFDPDELYRQEESLFDELDEADERAMQNEILDSGEYEALYQSQEEPLVRDGITRKPDSETVKVVTLPETHAPEFAHMKEFVKWVQEMLAEGGNVVISSTGETARFTNKNVRASAKRARAKTHRDAYLALRKMIENAEYDHYEPKDERHPNSGGQDVYYSALNMGGKLYSVKIKLDVITEEQRKPTESRGEELTADVSYKDHKLTEIEIAPTLYQSVTENSKTKQELGAISNVSLGVIRGNVKPSGISENVLYQLAYHGTPHNFDEFSLDNIGTGEGAQAHGWGLYFAKDKKISEEYRKRLSDVKKTGNYPHRYDILENGVAIDENLKNSIWDWLGAGATNLNNPQHKEILIDNIKTSIDRTDFEIKKIETKINKIKSAIDIIDKNQKMSITAFKNSQEGKIVQDDVVYRLYELAKNRAKNENRKQNISDIKYVLEDYLQRETRTYNAEQEYFNAVSKLDLENLKLKEKENTVGQLFEVDIPENDVLLDEDLPLEEQPLKVRQAIFEYYNSRPDTYMPLQSVEDVKGTNGEKFYNDVVFQMRMEGSKNPQKAASQLLNSLGIEGITYDGRRDGRCFVVFDDKAISVLEKYYQQQNEVHLAEEKLQEEIKEWEKKVDDIIASGKAPSSEILMLKQTPLIMSLIGKDTLTGKIASENGIYASPHFFDGTHPNMTPDMRKQIPQAMADPIAIFDSDNPKNRKNGDIVFMLDIKDSNGATTIVPVTLNVMGNNRVEINIATSAYTKENNGVPSNKWFENQIQTKKNARYINGQKMKAWQTGAGVYFPITGLTNAYGNKVYNESDLVKLRNANPAYYQNAVSPRAAFMPVEGAKGIIQFFQATDITTASHEIGHWLRFVLEESARLPNASRSKYEDWAAACEFVGANYGEKWTREQEEKFAEEFVKYLSKGKAPSNKLKRVFNNLKNLFVNIYKKIRGNVAVSKEMAEIFDRLLATEKEIKLARQKTGTVEINTPASRYELDTFVYMNPEQKETWENLRQKANEEAEEVMHDKLMKEYQAEKKKWKSEGRKIANDDIDHKRLAMIIEKGGIYLDEDMRMEYAESLNAIRKARPFQYNKIFTTDKSKSVDIDAVAERFGFEGESDIANVFGYLANIPNKQTFINNYVAEQELLWRSEWTTEEMVLNDKTEEALELLSNGLAQKIGAANLDNKKLRRAVISALKNNKIGDIEKYIEKYETAARESSILEKAQARKIEKLEEKIIRQRLDLLNQKRIALAVLREKYKAKEMRNKGVRYVKRVAKTKPKDIDFAYSEQIKALGNKFGVIISFFTFIHNCIYHYLKIFSLNFYMLFVVLVSRNIGCSSIGAKAHMASLGFEFENSSSIPFLYGHKPNLLLKSTANK